MYELSSIPCCVLSMTCLNNFRCVMIHQSNWFGLRENRSRKPWFFTWNIRLSSKFPHKTNPKESNVSIRVSMSQINSKAVWGFLRLCGTQFQQTTHVDFSRDWDREVASIYIYIYIYIYISQLRLKNPLIPTRLNPFFVHPYFCKLNHVLRPQAAKTHDALRWAVGIEGIPRKEWWVCGVFWCFTRNMMEHDHWTHGIFMEKWGTICKQSHIYPLAMKYGNWKSTVNGGVLCGNVHCHERPRKTAVATSAFLQQTNTDQK